MLRTIPYYFNVNHNAHCFCWATYHFTKFVSPILTHSNTTHPLFQARILFDMTHPGSGSCISRSSYAHPRWVGNANIHWFFLGIKSGYKTLFDYRSTLYCTQLLPSRSCGYLIFSLYFFAILKRPYLCQPYFPHLLHSPRFPFGT